MNLKLFFTVCPLLALSRMYHGGVSADQCPAQEPIYGKALKDHTFKTLPASSPFGCLHDCHYEVRCQSYNYVIKDNICEMNNRTKEAKPAKFVSDPERFYMKRGAHRVVLGSTPSLPAESCAEIKANEAGEAVSGNFWVEPTGSGAIILAYCDMHTEVADFCVRHLCQNSASCVNGPVGYLCLCNGLWTGTYCETAVQTAIPTTTSTTMTAPVPTVLSTTLSTSMSTSMSLTLSTTMSTSMSTTIQTTTPATTPTTTPGFGVIVVTGSVYGAGTDAHLYLELIGSNGTRSGEVWIRTEDGRNDDFEYGATDRFIVPFEDVGTISQLKLRLVDPLDTWGPAWTMEKIIIKDLARQISYTFYGDDERLDVYVDDTFTLDVRVTNYL